MPLSSFPDTSLPFLNIEKLKIGDPESFHTLYLSYHEPFLEKVTGFVNDRSEADLFVRHCFIKCWLCSEAITSWHFILGFLNATSWNYQSFKEEHKMLLIKTFASSFDSPCSEETIQKTGGDQLVNIRIVFEKFYWRRLSIGEIGLETGLSLAALQNFVCQALNMIRIAFSE